MQTVKYLCLFLVLPLTLLACGDGLEQVTAGKVGLSRTSIDIPQTQTGRMYNAQFALSNEGDGPLIVTDFQIVDSSPYITFSSSFMTQMALNYDWRQASSGQSWDTNPEFVMEPRFSIQIDIVFQPQDTNLECPNGGGSGQCGSVVVRTNDRNNPTVSVPLVLTQSAGIIEVEPTVLQFPDITGGPYTDEFTITNIGSGNLTIRTVNDPGVTGITYHESSNRQEPFALAQGSDAVYQVTFTPDSGTDYCDGEFDPDEGCTLGFMLIESDDARGNQISVALQVGGVSVPDIDVSTDTLEFDAAVGDPDTQTVDVSNEGGANLNWNLRVDPPEVRTLFTMEVAGEAVSVSGQQMDTMQAGNSETVALTLTPVDDSVVRGELVITAANDPDEAVTRVDIFGGDAVPELEVMPSQIDFPEVSQGDSADLQFVILNQGRATLNISSALFTQNPGAPEAPEFAISPNLAGATVPIDGQLPVTVTYTRPEEDLGGLDLATIQILSDSLPPNNDFLLNIFADHSATALPPVAIISVTPDEPYPVGTIITLDGSASTPPDDGELMSNPYSWAISAAPDGSTAGLSNDFEATTTLTPDVAGTYSVLLTITATAEGGQRTLGQVTRNLLVVAE